MTPEHRRPLTESLGFNLHRTAQLYRLELVRALTPYELTPEQWQILATLSSSQERLSQGEIAALTFKDKHSVSRMLDRLESAGWIVRHPDPDDARAFCIGLGTRAPEIVGIRALLAKRFSRIDSALDPTQRGELLALLGILRKHLGDSEKPLAPPSDTPPP